MPYLMGLVGTVLPSEKDQRGGIMSFGVDVVWCRKGVNLCFGNFGTLGGRE